MTLETDLKGRRVVVTGASSGLGEAICRSLVAGGAHVAMIARRKDRLDALEKEFGAPSFGLQADVTDFGTLEAKIGAAAERLGGIDTLVAAAGRSTVGTIASGDPQGWREIMDLNLVAPLATARHALKHFAETGKRDVIIIGSSAGLTPMNGVGIYGASKRGLKAAFDALRVELARSGIGVSIVLPGFFETEGLFAAVAINGEVPPMDAPIFLPEGGQPANPAIIGDTVAFMLRLPVGVAINEIVIRPTCQLNP